MTDQRTVRRALLLSAIGAAAAAGLIGPGAASADAADACPDVQVVFARGTAEPAGLGRVGAAFVDDLRDQLGGRTVTASAVNYPASYDFLQSAPAGADDASAQIQATAARCPDTRIVVGGYSQGAAVVDLITGDPAATFGFGRPMPAAVADHVAAVAVFGNPSGRIGRVLTTSSPLYGAKTIDLCNGADPVCSTGDDRPAHSHYVESGMVTQAADFAAGRLAGGAPAGVLVNASGTAG
ncbi:cutinase family protein [Mycolicibacterium chubuense]|uniref:Cutinase n=1 Tax=Mycolicibacterium chubuense TaxID=1800 RepID=A0A0J6VND0_MYCCU|nr:cutinase family protein [Mycolicibacterium chubuense]KMO72535.1 Cutinase [Mycolicibacterium chubuense]ORA42809.1 cutinase family protein [Mycolicibacterium chubuense]SPX99237.1 cutinase [Mycolicibacterium chubuense]